MSVVPFLMVVLSKPLVHVPKHLPRACEPCRRALVIEGGDQNAAFATLFYLYVVNGVLYAWHKGLTPIIAFNPLWTKRTLSECPWERFFEPYCGNVSCPEEERRPREFWYPGVHTRFEWSVRAWQYAKCPPHGHHHRLLCHHDDDEIQRYWRETAHQVVSRVHKPVRRVRRLVENAWRAFNPTKAPALAVHARGTDKKHGRRRIAAADFRLVVDSFLKTVRRGRVYLATEDETLAAAIAQDDLMVYVRDIRTRARGHDANFKVHFRHHYEVALDVLVDILLMAKCDFIVHGASAVSEAVIYTNIGLHNRSVNLEYTDGGARRPIPWNNRDSLVWDAVDARFRLLPVSDDFY